jgi:hypothetical protein
VYRIVPVSLSARPIAQGPNVVGAGTRPKLQQDE